MLLYAMALGLTIAGSGCATALNVQDASFCKPYGGFTMPINDFFGGGEPAEWASLLFWPIWLLDKPFSLFADTPTLPYLLVKQRDAQTPAKSQSPQPMQPAP